MGDEECDETDMYYEDSDEDTGLLKKALLVEFSKNFDPSKVPQTGEEYLQYVIHERSNCKTWITSDIDTSKFRGNQTFKIELENFPSEISRCHIPKIVWQEKKLEDFKQFRKFIATKGVSNQDLRLHYEDRDERVFNELPIFSNVIKYTQQANIRIIQLAIKYLNQQPTVESLNTKVGAWIYASLALLDIPLSPSDCHILRELVKKLIILRAQGSDSLSEDSYIPLNLFICIISRFFNQIDLADV